MDDNIIQPDAVAAVAAPSVCKVRCITDLKPWATVIAADGSQSLRPMDIDEVCVVSIAEGNVLQAHRHAIIVG